MSLQGISQFLAASLAAKRIYASQEEHILITIKNISTSLEVIKEKNIHELHPQEDIKSTFEHLCQFSKNTKDSWVTFDEEQLLELEIEGFLEILSSSPLCMKNIIHLEEKYMHGNIEEDIQSDPNGKMNLQHHDFIECWFQTSINSHHSFIIQKLFKPQHMKWIVSHDLVYIKVYFSNLSINVSL